MPMTPEEIIADAPQAIALGLKIVTGLKTVLSNPAHTAVDVVLFINSVDVEIVQLAEKIAADIKS